MTKEEEIRKEVKQIINKISIGEIEDRIKQDKQQKAIERANKLLELSTPFNNSKSVLISKTDLKTLLNMLKEKDEKIEKKDKIIDLMAETIRKLAFSLASYKGSYNKETINFTGNIKDIKQYFERKSEK